MKFIPRICLLILASAQLNSPAMGQVDRATLTGTVTDSSGSRIADATVTVSFAGTGLQREVHTSGAGSYYIPSLPIGACSLAVTKTGLQTVNVENLTLGVGETRNVDVRMDVATVKAEVTVEGNTSSLDLNSAATGGTVQPTQVQELPLNGRSWSTLMLLTQGAVDTGDSDQKSIRFAGRSIDENSFRFDGVDATGIVNQGLKGGARLQFSTESIAEFRVNSALYTAENGEVIGAQVDIVTKSGSNEIHGSAFEFLRNDKFDARSTFDSPTFPLPPFRLNQFGGSVGGPIKKNKAFFFANYEGLRQSLGQTLIGFVPSAAFRAQVLAQSPSLAPILDSYPAGTSATGDARVDQWTGRGSQNWREDSGMARFDYRFSDVTTVYARYSVDDALIVAPTSLLQTQITAVRPTNAVVDLLHVFSPTLVNEAKIGVNRPAYHLYIPSKVGSDVNVAGFSSLSFPFTNIQVPTSFSAIDNLTLIRGRHTFKTGVEIRRVHLNEGNSDLGQISFATLDDFLNNHLNSADFTGQLPIKGLRKTNVFAFVQDEFKFRPNLTFNVGLRYEFYQPFSVVQGREIPFDIPECGGYCAKGSDMYFPNYLDLDPRVSIAWSPNWSHGKTAIRTGFGIFHGEGQLNDLNAPVENDVTRFTLSEADIPNLSYPIDPFIPLTQNAKTPRALDRHRKDSTVQSWGLSVQQALPGNLTASVGYLGSEGYHIFTRSWLNTINPATGLRPLPTFGQIDTKTSDGISNFNALQLSVQRHFSGGLLVSGNYMWSHSINDGSVGAAEAIAPENIACRPCERGSSDQDVRHVFTASTVYELPFGKGRPFLNGDGLAGEIIGGWELTGFGMARTGIPVTILVSRNGSDLPDGVADNQRPNVVPGVSLTPPGGRTPNLWINPAAFSVPAPGTWGNSGRNTVRGPGLWQIDMGLSKEFKATERVGLKFRAEVFNLFNRAQYGNPDPNFSDPSFGRITSLINTGATGTGTPREIQISARVSF
jgi:hypothetical protein